MPEGFTYGGQTILSSPIFVETILPFLLVFTIVFAVLQKSKIFGEGKRQIDAIVALVAGLLVISFAKATGIIVQLIPFLAVALVIILVLMLLLGAVSEKELSLNKPIKYILATVIPLAVIIAVVYITGFWETVYEWIFISGSTNIFVNVIFVVIIVVAIIAVIKGGGGSSGGGSSSSGK